MSKKPGIELLYSEITVQFLRIYLRFTVMKMKKLNAFERVS